jgi:hypothetical protein
MRPASSSAHASSALLTSIPHLTGRAQTPNLGDHSGQPGHVPPPTPRVIPLILPQKESKPHRSYRDRRTSISADVPQSGLSGSETEQPQIRKEHVHLFDVCFPGLLLTHFNSVIGQLIQAVRELKPRKVLPRGKKENILARLRQTMANTFYLVLNRTLKTTRSVNVYHTQLTVVEPVYLCCSSRALLVDRQSLGPKCQHRNQRNIPIPRQSLHS